MDEGTNALEIIRGKVYPLKLGYVPVICRSQKDIQEGQNIADALKMEEVYFKTNDAYSSISIRTGVPFLCKTLNEIIVRHIK